MLIASADEETLSHAHAVTAQILVEHELVESHRLDEYAAGAVRQVDEFEIALEDTVFPRCAVDGDVGIIENHFLTVLEEGEIVAVNLSRSAIGEVHMPVLSFDIDDIDVVAHFVEEGIEALGRPERHIMLRGVASTYDGYGSFVLIHLYNIYNVLSLLVFVSLHPHMPLLDQLGKVVGHR